MATRAVASRSLVLPAALGAPCQVPLEPCLIRAIEGHASRKLPPGCEPRAVWLSSRCRRAVLSLR